MVVLCVIAGRVVVSASVIAVTVAAVVQVTEESMVLCVDAVAAGRRGNVVTATDRDISAVID